MDATIYRGTLPLIIEGPLIRRGRSGDLDTSSWTVIVHAENVDADLTGLGFTANGQVDGHGHAMFTEDWQEKPESDLVTEVSITCSGLITDDEKRRRVISYGQREIAVGPLEKVVLAWVKDEKGTDAETGDSVTEVKRRVPKLDEDGKPVYETIVTASGSHERWNIKEPICQVRDTYFSTTEPDGSAVGTASAPPNAPSAPANIWTSYDGDMRGNHPNGWVLEARDSEELFPGALWRVSDAWAYYQPELPD